MGMQSSGGFVSITWAETPQRLGSGRTTDWRTYTCSFHTAWGSSQHGNWVLKGRVLTASIPSRANNMIRSTLSHFSRV